MDIVTLQKKYDQLYNLSMNARRAQVVVDENLKCYRKCTQDNDKKRYHDNKLDEVLLLEKREREAKQSELF